VSEVRIVAEPRTEFGKGASRRVRRANKVPAVLYGHGDDPRHFSLPGHELMLALKADSNVLLTLETDKGDQLALPKVVVKDPIRGYLEHVDLIAVRKGEKVTVDIYVTLTGEAVPGVLVDQQLTTIAVEADATQLPDGVELDIEGLQAGAQLAAGDVKLPAGTTLVQDPEQIVVQGLAAPTAEEVEADLAESEAELGAGAAGAAAAPEGDVEVGSESDAAGEGDVVGETEAPTSETPADQ
jgi:large subunit ribosomal protein L25